MPTLLENVESEIARINAILARRGALYEDEQDRLTAMMDVKGWYVSDKVEAERIEIEARAAEEQENERRRQADPNYKTRKMFEGVKIRVPEKEWRR